MVSLKTAEALEGNPLLEAEQVNTISNMLTLASKGIVSPVRFFTGTIVFIALPLGKRTVCFKGYGLRNIVQQFNTDQNLTGQRVLFLQR